MLPLAAAAGVKAQSTIDCSSAQMGVHKHLATPPPLLRHFRNTAYYAAPYYICSIHRCYDNDDSSQ